MRKILSSLIIVICLTLPLQILGAEWLTIYNEDLALVRSQFNLPLEKGSQYYNFDNITSRLNTASVIVKSTTEPVIIAEQNYEYDLAGTEQILAKYIERELSVSTKNQMNYSGVMKFFDGQTIGLIEKGTAKLILINRAEIQQLQLAELPSNFYTKPTLRWKLLANRKSTYPMQLSYLTGGLSWEVTYNSTWDGKTLLLNSWVTINNQSGKGFEKVNLKLIAGEINQVRERFYGKAGASMYNRNVDFEAVAAAPSFEEKGFSDFHMYTLSEPVTFADKQIKHLQLFPIKTVKAETVYEYTVHSYAVLSRIKFENTEANGLGIPLPKGVFKIYKEDTDKNLEFIGEDNITHTAKNEEVALTTGNAFDLKGATLVKENRSLGNNNSEQDMQITLSNNSSETKTIRVIQQRDPNSDILRKTCNLEYELTEDNYYVWYVKIKPNSKFVLTYTTRYTYN